MAWFPVLGAAICGVVSLPGLRARMNIRHWRWGSAKMEVSKGTMPIVKMTVTQPVCRLPSQSKLQRTPATSLLRSLWGQAHMSNVSCHCQPSTPEVLLFRVVVECPGVVLLKAPSYFNRCNSDTSVLVCRDTTHSTAHIFPSAGVVSQRDTTPMQTTHGKVRV